MNVSILICDQGSDWKVSMLTCTVGQGTDLKVRILHDLKARAREQPLGSQSPYMVLKPFEIVTMAVEYLFFNAFMFVSL